MTNIRVGNAVLCEYATFGSSGKHVLVNTYSGDVIVGAFPANIGFGLYIEILQKLDKVGMTIALGDDEIAVVEAIVGDANAEMGVLMIPSIQMQLSEPQELLIMVKAEGYEDTIALRKKILLGYVPSPISSSASQPPSGQSPPGAQA